MVTMLLLYIGGVVFFSSEATTIIRQIYLN